MLRACCAVVAVLGLMSSAVAAPEVIDLDRGESAELQTLAAAAGACRRTLPASIRGRCGTASPAIARASRFVATFAVAEVAQPATRVIHGKPVAVTLSIAPRDYGKGFVLAPAVPPILCEPPSCLPGHAVLRVSLQTALPQDGAYRARIWFRTSKLWRAKAYWGPRISISRVEILRADDTTIAVSGVAR
jgi:hypothetical protein